jgi:hypothetical protein
MPDERWSPWKMTAIGMALVIGTALITGLVVASWNDTGKAPAPAGRTAARQAAAVPTTADVEACNAYARAQVGDKTLEVVKDAVIGGAIGAGVGAAGGAIAGGGRGAGQGAGVGGVVGVAAGTLYGLNEAKSHDARYVGAYRACMQGRGYTG